MTHRLYFLACIVFTVAISLVWWLDARLPEPLALTPALTGQEEYCLSCHIDLAGISPSHPVETFGCVLCHGGERLALDADLAHGSLRGGANPSDLAVVEQSCGGGDCHSGDPADGRDHIQRVMTSIQVTYTGAITNLRYTFGAQPDLMPRYAASAVQDASLPSRTGILALAEFDPESEANPSLQAFGINCLTCHINAGPGVGAQYERFTGCAACHAPKPEGEGAVHSLTTAIPYTRCNACHNRGNYDLRKMTFIERTDQVADRQHAYYQPISQFVRCEVTLDCVDCHTRREAMGDGDLHATQADVQYIQCKTCHGTLTELPLTMNLQDPEAIAFRQVFLNPVSDLQPGDTVLITEQGEALWNTRLLPDGTYELIGKATGQHFNFRPVMGSGCQQDPALQESRYCHACHAVEH